MHGPIELEKDPLDPTPAVRAEPQPQPIRACTPPTCTVVRDAARAPAAIRDVAATVDFTKFVLVIVERMESPFGPEEHTFDGTVQPAKGGGVLELPAEPCPYCGGAAPPQPRKQQIVVRVPRFDGELRVRSRPSACAPCDPRLP